MQNIALDEIDLFDADKISIRTFENTKQAFLSNIKIEPVKLNPRHYVLTDDLVNEPE